MSQYLHAVMLVYPCCKVDVLVKEPRSGDSKRTHCTISDMCLGVETPNILIVLSLTCAMSEHPLNKVKSCPEQVDGDVNFFLVLEKKR